MSRGFGFNRIAIKKLQSRVSPYEDITTTLQNVLKELDKLENYENENKKLYQIIEELKSIVHEMYENNLRKVRGDECRSGNNSN